MNGTPTPPTPPSPPPPPPTATPVAQTVGASGRAITALILGIAAVLCCGIFTGIPAFFIGRSEEAAINRGQAPEGGRTMAKIGWILGLISIIFGCLTILGFGAYIALVGMPQMPPKTF